MKYVSLADTGGYGQAAIAYLSGLHQAGVRLAWTPLFQSSAGYRAAATAGEAGRRLRTLSLPRETVDLYGAVVAPGQNRGTAAAGGPPAMVDARLCVLHTIPELWPDWRQPRVRQVGYTVWETTNVPPHWPELLGLVDHLLTPSRFSAETFANAGVHVPVDVVPHVPRARSPLADGARFRDAHGIPGDHTLFYTIGAWTSRKAVWSTLHAYCAAFSDRDPTTLVVKTDAAGPSHEGDSRRHPVQQLVRDLVGNYPDAPHVCLIVRDLTQADVDDLHAAGDCYVSLTHAEGWGLGAFDAACAGNPVVITGWGGPLDYLSKEDAFLLEYELASVRDGLGGGSYRRDQQWAVARLDDAIERLRWVHGHRSAAAAMGARLGARVRCDFDAGRIIDRLRALLDA